jgi:acyl carrier protein
MSDDTDLVARLRQILGDVAPDLDVAAVPADADLRNDIGIDSMDYLNFIIAISKQLAVTIPEADYGKVRTLAHCAAYIMSAKATPAAPRQP